MPTDFAVQTHTNGRAATLALSGELDLLSAPALMGALEGATAPDTDLIVIDLRGVEFIDSIGLHALLEAAQRTQATGRRFALVRGGQQVQRLFELTGVTDGLTIVDSPEQLFEAHGSA